MPKPAEKSPFGALSAQAWEKLTQEMLQLVATQGVPSHDHVNAQRGRHQRGNLPSISVVPVHRVQLAGRPCLAQSNGRPAGVGNGAVRKLPDVWPELLLPACS